MPNKSKPDSSGFFTPVRNLSANCTSSGYQYRNAMKKLVLLLFAVFALQGCSTDDNDQPLVYYELLPIDRCRMPYYFHSGESYEFTMTYRLPTTCHNYKGIYFEKKGDVYEAAIQSLVYARNDCQTIDYNSSAQPAPQASEAVVQFTANAPAGTTYTFRMWTGKDDQGQDTYYDVDVPVTQ